MVVPVRGTWQIDEGINKRWVAAALDATFRNRWRRSLTEYPVLHDTMAKPTPPGPYCVYEIGDPVIVGHSTGPEVHSEHQLQNIPVQFRIHAKGDTKTTGKSIAIDLAKAVAAAFDNQFLDFGYDKHVMTTKEVDFGAPEGDEEYVWVVPYTWLVDAVLRRTVRRDVEI